MVRQQGRWVRRGSTIVVVDLDGGEMELEVDVSSRRTLRRGSRGSDVGDLQSRLAAAGFDAGPVDSVFGSLTDTAVRAYQRAHGLAADGVVGPQTWAALDAARQSPAPGGPPPSRAPAGGDPAIEALGLAEPARSGAYLLKSKLLWV